MTPVPGTTAALIAEVLAATAECTQAMQEQFLAVVANDPGLPSFDARIADANHRRRLAVEALHDYVSINGW